MMAAMEKKAGHRLKLKNTLQMLQNSKLAILE
jgi:hypothetical protein